MDAENRSPQAGQGIGRRLEMAREARGLSLREVEERTRIRSRYLRDLERENFDVLPAVYVLGSLKTYADFLGLDGVALSGQLKSSLEETAGQDPPAHVQASEDTGDDAGGTGILPAIGFDQLFLGAGVIMISILAIMTLVAAVAQEDRSPISEINEPSTPETPSEVALAGIVEEDTVPRPVDGAEKFEEADGDGRERPQTSKDDGAEEGRDRAGDRGDPRSNSVFGDVDSVRASPASPSAQPTASASAGSASPAPAADRGASPDRSSNAAATASAASPGNASTAPSRSAPSGGAASGPPAGREPAPAFDSEADRISAGADRAVGQALAKAGIER